MKRTGLIKTFIEAGKGFSKHEVLSLSAALSFYTILSFAPLMVLAIWITSGLAPGAQETVLGQVRSLAGSGAYEVAQSVIENAKNRPSLGSLAGILGIVVSLVAATTVFAQLQAALNRIWGIEAQPQNALLGWLRRRLLSIGVIAAIGFVLVVSLVVSAALGMVLRQASPVWDVVNQIISGLVFAGLFALLFRYLPDARLPWRNTLSGGLLTAVLFTLGKTLISFYLSSKDVGSAYGAAGSLVIMLVWVYYASAIFFFGAEFELARTRLRGKQIPLTEHAEPREPKNCDKE